MKNHVELTNFKIKKHMESMKISVFLTITKHIMYLYCHNTWGDDEAGCDHTGEPEVEALGQHKNTLPLVGRVLGNMQLYGEWERGGWKKVE